MRLSYTPDYFVQLPPAHPIPMGKFPPIKHIILTKGLIRTQDIVEPEQRTLFEPSIQQALYRDIYSRRIAEAQGDFINGILRQGIYDDIKMMEEKIVSIALMRFLARR